MNQVKRFYMIFFTVKHALLRGFYSRKHPVCSLSRSYKNVLPASPLLRGEGGYLSVLAILLIMMVGFLGSTLSYLFTDKNALPGSPLLKREGGYLSVLAILLIMMVGFLGSTLSYLFTDTTNATLNSFLANKAYYIAQAGTEEASRYVLAKGVTCGNVTGNSDLTNASFGGGQFTVTGTATVASTTASGVIGSGDTSIVLTNAASFAASGIITIDTEVMSYASRSGNTLMGVSRGIFSTTAASHASGATVSQNQCTLDSTAGVPTLSSPLAKSEIIKIIPLFSMIGSMGGWTVGNVSGGRPIAAQWNGSSWVNYSFPATSDNATGVTVLNASTAWTTGLRADSYYWNGSTWTSSSTSPTSADNMGVSCGAANDCHLVGARSGNNPGLVNGNGTPGSWSSRQNASGVSARTLLNSVSCSSASNCWAVGSNSGGAIFYRWTGSGWTGYSQTLSGFRFNSVFCNSSTDCWAVGANATFARFTGSTTWSNFATGLPAAQYNSVFCNSSSDCWAVGNVNAGRDLIVHWNGTSWSRDAANPTPTANLKGVSCASATNCWAVGASTSGSNPTFVQWNGTTWSNVAAPSGMPTGVGLNAIAFGGGAGVSIPSNSAIVIQEFA